MCRRSCTRRARSRCRPSTAPIPRRRSRAMSSARPPMSWAAIRFTGRTGSISWTARSPAPSRPPNGATRRWDDRRATRPLIPLPPASIRPRWPEGRHQPAKPWSAAPVAGGRIRQGEATMKLHELRDNDGATRRKKRIGRGPGSGMGKMGGRGIKGQKSRSGLAIKGYEGGQMPLYQRLPKRGFNKPNRKQFAVVNLGLIQKFIDAGKLGEEITETELVDSGLVRRKLDGVRVLASGDFSAAARITVTGASKSAVEAVEKAGGTLTVTSAPDKAAASE